MKVVKKVIFSEARDYVILIFFGITVSLISIALNPEHPFEVFIPIASLTCITWILLWKGNSYLANYLSNRISWIRFPVKRFVVGLLATVGYTLAATFLLSLTYNQYNDDLALTYISSIIITITISLFMHGRAFLMNWKKTLLEAEKYQRESLVAKYEALKNQVNPHFLFNSLNALTNLVYDDKQKASLFIKQLEEVYRYVLNSKDKGLVPLKEELEFLRAYLFLQQIRFGSKLRVTFNLSDNDLQVAPLAVQMLIENAIKHNIVSESDPLDIQIFQDGDFIVVQNNLQLRSSVGESSLGIGLENIIKRYESLGNGTVEVVQNEKYFIVRIPLVKNTARLSSYQL
jgi:LytS/YehU family sensor histidine kinase